MNMDPQKQRFACNSLIFACHYKYSTKPIESIQYSSYKSHRKSKECTYHNTSKMKSFSNADCSGD